MTFYTHYSPNVFMPSDSLFDKIFNFPNLWKACAIIGLVAVPAAAIYLLPTRREKLTDSVAIHTSIADGVVDTEVSCIETTQEMFNDKNDDDWVYVPRNRVRRVKVSTELSYRLRPFTEDGFTADTGVLRSKAYQIIRESYPNVAWKDRENVVTKAVAIATTKLQIHGLLDKHESLYERAKEVVYTKVGDSMNRTMTRVFNFATDSDDPLWRR
jgi:hypothetical protein